MNDDIRQKIDNFFNPYPEVKYPKGQILIFPNERIGRIFHLISGRVCQHSISYRGDEIVVNTFKPPAFFPMAQAINQLPSNFFYRTETDSVIKVAPPNEVVKFLHDNPDVAFDLLGRVYNGVETVLERMVHLMSGTAKSRLIFELIIEFRRFSHISRGAGFIDITEAGIASRSGLSRETVSREIKHLKDKGIVEVASHRIFIKNITELEKQIDPRIRLK